MSERPPISPRSPRAALEPEQLPPPPKRSDRARNPFVVAGNAIITLLIVAMVGAGAIYVYGKQKLEAAGPLQQDRIVNIPARSGMSDIADILQREGVIVRPIAAYGMPEWLRVSIGLPEENARFIDALRSVLADA